MKRCRFHKAGCFVLTTVLLLCCALASCTRLPQYPLSFEKTTKNDSLQAGENLDLYDTADVFSLGNDLEVLVSAKSYISKNNPAQDGKLMSELSFSGAVNSCKVKNVTLHLVWINAGVTSYEMFDTQKQSQNFYDFPSTLDYSYQNTLSAEGQMLSADVAFSLTAADADLRLEWEYDLEGPDGTVIHRTIATDAPLC